MSLINDAVNAAANPSISSISALVSNIRGEAQSFTGTNFSKALRDAIAKVTNQPTASASSNLRSQIDFLDSAIQYSRDNTIQLNQQASPSDRLLSPEQKQMAKLLQDADVDRDGVVTTEELQDMKEKQLKKMNTNQDLMAGKLVEEALYSRKTKPAKSIIGEPPGLALKTKAAHKLEAKEALIPEQLPHLKIKNSMSQVKGLARKTGLGLS